MVAGGGRPAHLAHCHEQAETETRTDRLGVWSREGVEQAGTPDHRQPRAGPARSLRGDRGVGPGRRDRNRGSRSLSGRYRYRTPQGALQSRGCLRFPNGCQGQNVLCRDRLGGTCSDARTEWHQMRTQLGASRGQDALADSCRCKYLREDGTAQWFPKRHWEDTASRPSDSLEPRGLTHDLSRICRESSSLPSRDLDTQAVLLAVIQRLRPAAHAGSLWQLAASFAPPRTQRTGLATCKELPDEVGSLCCCEIHRRKITYN